MNWLGWSALGTTLLSLGMGVLLWVETRRARKAEKELWAYKVKYKTATKLKDNYAERLASLNKVHRDLVRATVSADPDAAFKWLFGASSTDNDQN